MRLRLATLNTWGLPFPIAPHPRRLRFPRIARWLRAGAFDVVGLQEVWNGAPRLDVPNLHLSDRRDGDSGLALWAAFSVENVRTHAFSVAHGMDALKRKGALHVRLRLPSGGPLDVVTTHLQAQRSRAAVAMRARQADELVGFLDGIDGPCVVLGDFNLHDGLHEDDATLHRLHDAGLRDVADGHTRERTHIREAHRFDRIFTRDSGAARFDHVCARVEKYGSALPMLSDHLAVLAEVRLATSAPTGR